MIVNRHAINKAQHGNYADTRFSNLEIHEAVKQERV